MRMLRWARGNTSLDHIRNEDISKEAHIKPVETFLENERLFKAVWPPVLGEGAEVVRKKDGGIIT